MKQRLINWFFGRIIKVTNPNDVIRQDAGKIYLGTKMITEQERKSLISEIKALENMRIWSIINETVKQAAFERGWKNSTTIEELNIAKTEYRTLEVQQSIINVIKGK